VKKDRMIIFDMDGVLVDVSGSYREVTRLSVVHYLRFVTGVKNLRDDFISLIDVSAIKKNGGLNNDWDLTYTIINTLLFSLFHEHNKHLNNDFLALRAIKKDDELFHAVGELRDKCDPAILESRLNRMSQTQKMSVSGFYFQIKEQIREHSPFLINHGDVNTGNLAKRIFQEIYLGNGMFQKIYGVDPLFYQGEGYINREALIPSPSLLKRLAARTTLTVATGRPGVEALHSLRQFNIMDMFSAVVTEDDVVQAEKNEGKSLRKPHPFIINLCMQRCGCKKTGGVFYIGDMPDDMVASISAGITPVGFVNDRSNESNDEKLQHRALLIGKGAREVFGNFKELESYLKEEFNA